MGMRNVLLPVVLLTLMLIEPMMASSINITSCNPTFTAGTNGATYTVTANLTAAANANCIVVTAADVTINLNRFTLTGAGTAPGTGIVIQPAAAGAHIVGGTITGFTTGIMDSASSVLLEALTVRSNLGSGVTMKSVNGSVLATSSITGNGANGVYLLNTRDGLVNHNVAISGNGTAGPGYGVFIQNNATGSLSYDNVVADNVFGSGGTQLAAVWVGTSNNAPLTCGKTGAASSGNVIVGNQSINRDAAVGIGLECGFASSNIVSDNSASGNISFDLFDGNASCDSNSWIADVFSTANQTCVH
jgi:hypothetical protein